jgi:hypothetical protein
LEVRLSVGSGWALDFGSWELTELPTPNHSQLPTPNWRFLAEVERWKFGWELGVGSGWALDFGSWELTRELTC